MSVLSEYLRAEAAGLRAGAEQRKAAKLDWQRAVHTLMQQLHDWLRDADRDGVLRVEWTEPRADDYDLAGLTLPRLRVTLGRKELRIYAVGLEVVGVIQPPGEPVPRRIDGRIDLDNGMERVPLYRVKDGNRDVWLWWTHGAVGKPFDRESFEATVVGLLR